MSPLSHRRRRRTSKAFSRSIDTIRTRRRSSPREVLRRTRHRHNPAATWNFASILRSQKPIGQRRLGITNAIIQRLNDSHTTGRHRYLSSLVLPQSGTSRGRLSILHAMKIPFYDLTFLRQHHKNSGSVLSERVKTIGIPPTRHERHHLHSSRTKTYVQDSTLGYDGTIIEKGRELAFMKRPTTSM
jgi:hypothetical protein